MWNLRNSHKAALVLAVAILLTTGSSCLKRATLTTAGGDLLKVVPGPFSIQIGASTAVNDFGRNVAIDSDYNTYVVGQTLGALPGQTQVGLADAYVAKIDPQGNVLWINQFGTTADDNGRGVALDSQKNVYVAGTAGAVAVALNTICNGNNNPSKGGTDAFLAKFSNSGQCIWLRFLGGTLADGGKDVAIDSADNIYTAGFVGDLVGTCVTTGCLAQDGFLAKYRTDGSPDTSGNWGATGTISIGTAAADSLEALAIDKNQDVIVVGQTAGALSGYTAGGSDDAFLVKVSAAGTSIWYRQFVTGFSASILSAVGSDIPYDVAIDTNNNIYVAGETGSGFFAAVSGVSDMFISKVSADGNFSWGLMKGTAAGDTGRGVTVDSQNNIYLLGQVLGFYAHPLESTNGDIALTKLDSNGMEFYRHQYGALGAFVYIPGAIVADDSGYVHIVGSTNNTSGGQLNATILRKNFN